MEIPSILIAGQGGLLLAGALIGRRSALSVGERLRKVVPDVVTLISAVALMLIWAGIVEGFFSQYHAPVIAYSVKIAFGVVELSLLISFLHFSGRKPVEPMTWKRIRGWFTNFGGTRTRTDRSGTQKGPTPGMSLKS